VLTINTNKFSLRTVAAGPSELSSESLMVLWTNDNALGARNCERTASDKTSKRRWRINRHTDIAMYPTVSCPRSPHAITLFKLTRATTTDAQRACNFNIAGYFEPRASTSSHRRCRRRWCSRSICPCTRSASFIHNSTSRETTRLKHAHMH